MKAVSYTHLDVYKRQVRTRALHPIDTTFELVDVIKKALPAKVLNKKGHPAKQTFQACLLYTSRCV